MSVVDRQALIAEAHALPRSAISPVSVPIPIALQEAAGVARFVRTYWEPAADQSRPGLVTVNGTLRRDIEDDIHALINLCSEQHMKVLFPDADSGNRRALVGRAEKLVANLGAALDYVLDDGVSEPTDEAWHAARQRDAEDGTQAGLAQALVDYAAVAEGIVDRLRRLADFDEGCLVEARTLAQEILRQGPPSMERGASQDVELRNRLLTVLSSRLAAVRRAARYVFRDYPQIVREVTSAYERKRRAANRKSTAAQPSAST